MRQALIIAQKEFGDRLRSGWVIACAMVWLGAISLTSLFGLVQIGRIGVQGYERTAASLLDLVQYLVPLLGLLLGHDLLVSEREERTLALLLAGGVKRRNVLLGKLLGGCVGLGVPLVLGFAVAGTIIGLATKDSGAFPFLKLAVSGLFLGCIFLGIGLMISTFARTRLQALVFALLTWCVAVFAFDLLAMGWLVVAETPQATREVEIATDATHVNATADLHAAFESGDDAQARTVARSQTDVPPWLLVNPVDLFRAWNLPGDVAPRLSLPAALVSIWLWLLGCPCAANWRFNRLDL